MSNAICICPDFVGQNISNTLIFSSFFISTLCESPSQVLFDSNEVLKLEYLKSVKNSYLAFEMYKSWQETLEAQKPGKILITDSLTTSENIKDVIYSIIVKAATTFNKSLVVCDNNDYEPYVKELTRQKIHLLSASSLELLRDTNMKNKQLTYGEFDYDLSWVIHRLGRRHLKGSAEDDYNDYIRDMLLSKNYEVHDQSREGKSQSGINAGELDLVVENNGTLFSIIEALILSSVDKANILKHYIKLLKNYNPLQVKRTFMVVYYEGTRFDEWSERYLEYVKSLSTIDFSLDGYDVVDTIEIDSPFMGLKKIEQHFTYGGEHFACIHYAVKV